MSKYSANLVGFTSSYSGAINDLKYSGVWNIYDQYELRLRGDWAIGAGLTADGNYFTYATGSHAYVTFTGPGTLYVTASPGPTINLEVLMVAGGGGGGWYTPTGGNSGGGGGAGGLIYHPAMPIATGSYPVAVGSGGASARIVASGYIGANGTNTTFNGFTALGGGYGGGYNASGGPGGSGASPLQPGAQPAQPQPAVPGYFQYGNPGGPLHSIGAGQYSGGGGAGSAGGGVPGYLGGDGRQYPQFSEASTGRTVTLPAPHTGYFAGGGGGTLYTAGNPYDGGLGGGGGPTIGFVPSSPAGTAYNGTANTGGGGAGGINGDKVGSGGSGIVIVRRAL